MSRIERSLSRLLCAAISALQADTRQPWARAIRAETEAIADDGAAFGFALDAFLGMLPGLIARLFMPPPLHGDGHMSDEAPGDDPSGPFRPATLVIGCAAAATILGASSLLSSGAPLHYALINVAALAIGLAIWAMWRLARWDRPGAVLPAALLGGLLLCSFAFGTTAAGATRWFALGPILIQPSLIVLPPLLILFAQSRSPLVSLVMVGAILVIAAQPDRAVGAVALAGVLCVALREPDVPGLGVFAIAALAFGYTMLMPDRLPATPFVDGALRGDFADGPLTLVAVWASVGLLLVPAIVGWVRHAEARFAYGVFGAIWAAVILAAVLGNYPSPAAGYGGSAIVGYILSGAALSLSSACLRQASAPSAARVIGHDETDMQRVVA